VPGIIIFLAGVYLVFTPTILVQGSNQLGFSTSQNIVDRDVLVSIRPGNYSSLSVPLYPQQTITANVSSNPPGTDVLLMNQGNYSEYVATNGSLVSIYPESLVNVSTYTLFFNYPGSTGNYYLVFRNPQSSQTTDVLVQLTVSSEAALSYLAYISVIIVGIGLIFLVIGALSGKKKESSKKTSHSSRSEALQIVDSTTKCRYCNASMNRGDMFCPSCKKSQT
jgi:hypothetical protein